LNLVTGGAGFIGSHLVSELLGRGEKVRVLERPGAKTDHLPLDDLELVSADIRDRSAVHTAIRGCQRVYHLAANPNLWTRRRQDFHDVNYLGSVHVLEESLLLGVERVLHTSTESVLSAPGHVGLIGETFQPRREEMVGPYCVSKFDAEQAAFKLAKDGGQVLIVSPTLPVGPGDYGLSPPTRMTLACCRGKLPAYLDVAFNMIDARDVAIGMCQAMDKGVPGKRYLLGFENLRLEDWLSRVAHAVGRPAPKYKVPYAVALLTGYLSEFYADHVSGQMPMATVTGVRLAKRVMHFDPSHSLQELGLKPRPLEKSLADAIEWYRQVGFL
jgi:dihydroflavonol-4-reductase